jgi:hypothetical protein
MSTITYENYLVSYKELSRTMQTLVRRTASLELQSRGVYEIGSSDVSCTVFDLYRSLGSFEAIVRYGLELIEND